MSWSWQDDSGWDADEAYNHEQEIAAEEGDAANRAAANRGSDRESSNVDQSATGDMSIAKGV